MSPEVIAAIIGAAAALAAGAMGLLANRRAGQAVAEVEPPVMPVHGRGEPQLTSADERDSFRADDVLKVFDFRANHAHKLAPPGSADGTLGSTVETDVYQLHRVSDSRDTAVFIYATNGDLRDGHSVSHPGASSWRPSNAKHLRVCYSLTTDLSRLAKGEGTRLVNQVTFVGAFEGAEREWVETHIDRPSRSLTFMLLFSPDWPCTGIRGVRSLGRGEPVETKVKPLLLAGGTAAYWRVGADPDDAPQLNAEYRLEWTWGPGGQPVVLDQTDDLGIALPGHR